MLIHPHGVSGRVGRRQQIADLNRTICIRIDQAPNAAGQCDGVFAIRDRARLRECQAGVDAIRTADDSGNRAIVRRVGNTQLAQVVLIQRYLDWPFSAPFNRLTLSAGKTRALPLRLNPIRTKRSRWRYII